MFQNKHSVSMKSRRRFLHLSSFSDSNSFMTAGPYCIILYINYECTSPLISSRTCFCMIQYILYLTMYSVTLTQRDCFCLVVIWDRANGSGRGQKQAQGHVEQKTGPKLMTITQHSTLKTPDSDPCI